MHSKAFLPRSTRGSLSLAWGLALAWAAPLPANEYDLELVVFLSHAAPSTELNRGDSNRGAALDRRIQTLFERTGAVVAFPVEAGRMGGVVEKLRASADFLVLQHVTWRQEVQLISEAPYVDVSTLSLGDERSGLKGLVRFYHSPLLYADVLMRYEPLSDPGLSEVADGGWDTLAMPGESYFLDEKRRLRLKELHYLDSPKIGAILSVWPIEDEAASLE